METEYISATYSNILDQMLDRRAQPGQGGHLEGNAAEVKRALARLNCYSFLASEVADVFDVDRTDSLLREAVRRLGRYRGNEIRREVEGRGLPLDVQHSIDRISDSPEEKSRRTAIALDYQERMGKRMSTGMACWIQAKNQVIV